ncbi:MAG: NAD(P)-dependent oxidoreductase [Candidatus Bilamarchaeaceae archaeon]
MKNKKIFLIGANGRLGKKICQKLYEEGLSFIPIVRKQSGLKNEIVCNFSIEELREILKKADVIINTAGSTKTYDKREMERGNVELVKNIVEAAPKNAKIIHASSISVYGKMLAKKPADEQTPIRPDSEYAKTKYEAEKILSQNKNVVVLRIGTIYDESDDYVYIVKKIKEGKMYIIGNGNNRIPFVHIDDVASAFLAALKAPPGVYNIVGDPITQKEAYQIVSNVLGVKPPQKHIPFWLANLYAFIEEKVSSIWGKKPKITREHVAILFFDRVFDCSLAKEVLGFNPQKNADGIKKVTETILQKNL